MEVRASARRPSGSGGKGEWTKGRGIVGRGTWGGDLPIGGVASAGVAVVRGGAVVWRVDTPAVPRSLGGGGCSATAAAPRVDIFDSTPEAGICRSGPRVCVSVRVTGEAKKVTWAGSWRVDTPAVPCSLGGGGCRATAAVPLVGIFDSTPDAGLCFAGPGVRVSVRAMVEANFEGSCR
jgi:hypothetical protein